MLDSKQTADYLEQLLSCRSLTELWKMYLEILAVFDFNRIIYATTNLGKSGLSESLKDGLVLSNHHPTLIKEMVRNKCFDNDTRWFSKNKINVLPWAEAIDTKEVDYSKYLFFPTLETPASIYEKNAVKNYQKFDLNAGYTIFFKHSTGTGSSGFSLCSKLSQSDTNLQWKKNGKTIITLSKLFDLHLWQLPYVHFSLLPIRRRLTNRQRETLYWVSKGKSIFETSIIMNLSVPTIDKHLRLARENLDSKTTIEAMVKAQTNAQLYDFGFKT